MMAARIDCYFDIASSYSYFGFLHLQDNADLLKTHGVHLEFHPVLLGGINQASGNQPPWALAPKAKYIQYDIPRTVERFGVKNFKVPGDFTQMNVPVLPLRALHFIKTHHPAPTFIAALDALFRAFWSPPNPNINQPDILRHVLSAIPCAGQGQSTSSKPSDTLFSTADVERIMQGASSQEVRDALKRTTQQAVDKGAFGAPWLWVRNRQGKEEPFFGSDRFHFVWKHLELPYQDVKLLPPSGTQLSKSEPKL